jgi:DNA-binding XRE family transcriptional regulator
MVAVRKDLCDSEPLWQSAILDFTGFTQTSAIPAALRNAELTLPDFRRRIAPMTTPGKKPLRKPARQLRPASDPLCGSAGGEIAGRKVRAWRERRGLTLHQLGRRSGVSPNTIDRLERGSSHQSIIIRALIAAGLGVPMCQLWTQDEKMFKKVSPRRLKRARAMAID